MTSDRWLKIDSLFDTAIRLDPAERGDWLRRACGDDRRVRHHVEASHQPADVAICLREIRQVLDEDDDGR